MHINIFILLVLICKVSLVTFADDATPVIAGTAFIS